MTKIKDDNQVLKELEIISKDGIRSYEYIIKIGEMVNQSGKLYEHSMINLLKKYTDIDRCSEKIKNVLFTAYYSLAYYYKRYDKVDELGKLIACYACRFNYAPLRDEVSAWYYRRKGDLKKAFSLDKTLISRIEIYENSGPYVSFASSVLMLLEKENDNNFLGKSEKEWECDEERIRDWSTAYKAIDTVLEEYHRRRPGKYYGKHYAIKGRLLLYKPNLKHEKIEEINRVFNEANLMFEKAIQNENIKEEDYYKRYTEYCSYQSRCELLRLKYWSKIQTDENQKKIEELTELESTLREKINEQKAQEIELLSVFTAIISIVLVGGEIAISFSLLKAELLIIVLFTCCVAFLCALNIILFEKSKKAVVCLIIALGIIIFTVLVSVSISMNYSIWI